jgi:hypothetical protein
MQMGIGINIGSGQKAPESGVLVNRLYFSTAQTPDVSPAFAAWTTTTSVDRRKLLNAKEAGEAMASVFFASTTTLRLLRQFVSLPLKAQTVTGNVKCQIRALDNDLDGNITARLLAKVVSGDGLTLRGVLLAIADYSTGTFFAASERNKAFANGDAVSSVDAQEGDRLVVEIGCNAPSGGGVQVDFGAPSATSDLPENETETGNLVPWIEFSNGLVFQA